MEIKVLIKKAVEFHKEFKSLKDGKYSEINLGFEDLTDYIFERGKCTINWNEDNDVEDLELTDNNTYSVDINWVIYEDDEFLLVDADDGCGDRHSQYLFLKTNEVKF